jgi:hypothetical protein
MSDILSLYGQRPRILEVLDILVYELELEKTVEYQTRTHDWSAYLQRRQHPEDLRFTQLRTC